MANKVKTTLVDTKCIDAASYYFMFFCKVIHDTQYDIHNT